MKTKCNLRTFYKVKLNQRADHIKIILNTFLKGLLSLASEELPKFNNQFDDIKWQDSELYPRSTGFNL